MKNTIIVLVVVALAVAAYVIVAPFSNPVATPSPTASIVPTISPTPTATLRPVLRRTPTPTPGVIIRISTTFQVNIASLLYTPRSTTAHVGDVVVFTNNDAMPHTVTAAGYFDSGSIAPSDSWTLATANMRPGTYYYRCSIHPSMQGVLIVK